MVIHPPCSCCPERTSYDVFPSLSYAVKAARGVVNASYPTSLGAVPGWVIHDRLGDTPIEESDYHGWFRDIEVTAVYPVSKFSQETGEWAQVRTYTKTWRRLHTGPTVVEAFGQVEYDDSYEVHGLPLADDESSRPSDSTPEGDIGGDGFLIPASSAVASSSVDAAELQQKTVDKLPDQWSAPRENYNAAPNILSMGAAAGVWMNDFGDNAIPSSCEVVMGKWAAVVTSSDDVIPAFYNPLPSPLRARCRIVTYDLNQNENAEQGSFVITKNCAWRSSLGFWASFTNGANPESDGWTTLEDGLSPGLLRVVDMESDYILDLGHRIHQ